jgi:hypothetical protein
MADLRITVGIVAAAGVVIGFGLVSLLRGNDDEPLPSPVVTPSQENAANISGEIAACQDDLALERSSRIALAEKMERQIDRLGKQLALCQSKPGEPKTPEEAAQDIIDISPDSLWARGSFSDDALLELGVEPAEIEKLRERFEALELSERETRDIATREGWSEHSLYGHEIQAMRREFREEVGDENYDKVLYAAGRNNRARVGHMVRGSAAENAGIQVGDVIVGYAGERIFDPPSVFELTTQAERGENTRVEILRDGEIISLIVPRGPMGIDFERIRVPPGS